ncbi:hypothetical protein HDU76_008311 [Blyttiomyces sp. JEL0837]|nr:hypothetical protein HDU76_008311 [Blyttiomyces sp. JEL0837]
MASFASRFISKAIVEGDDSHEIPIGGADSSSTSSSAPYDPRTLYERLQEQKQKKDDEFAAKTKLGNLIKKLDPEEIEFLRNEEEKQKQKLQQEQQEVEANLAEFRKQAAELRSLDSTDDHVTPHALPIVFPTTTTKATTKSTNKNGAGSKGLISTVGVVRKKRPAEEPASTKEKSTNEKTNSSKTVEGASEVTKKLKPSSETKSPASATKPPAPVAKPAGALNMLAGYGSDDEDSS